MVGLLWKARQFAAAIRLEQLWNKLLEQSAFSFYCAYAIDVFGKDFEVANLPSGRPTLRLHGEAGRIAATMGVTSISLSITHTSELGMAHVILEG